MDMSSTETLCCNKHQRAVFWMGKAKDPWVLRVFLWQQCVCESLSCLSSYPAGSFCSNSYVIFLTTQTFGKRNPKSFLSDISVEWTHLHCKFQFELIIYGPKSQAPMTSDESLVKVSGQANSVTRETIVLVNNSGCCSIQLGTVQRNFDMHLV